MTTGKRFSLSILLLAAPLFASCSGSSGGGGIGSTLVSVEQDLGVDPTGATTVVTFPFDVPATLTPGNFEADGGQLATGVSVVGPVATVTWDERVTPSHRVRGVSIGGIAAVYETVTTSDPGEPTFTLSGGTQTPGLGGDSFTAQFSGARLVEALAEDVANWDLQVSGTSLDLTGSTFDLDPATQILSVTLGTGANLHATFSLVPAGVTSVADVALTTAVTGTASGDAVAPTLVSAEQNLAESEYGFVVDFTFSESMDPILNSMGAFDAGFPVFSTQVEQPSEELLRVTFTAPVVPGVDLVDIDVVDAHGNGLSSTVAIAAGSTVANGFDVGFPTATTVPNAGGDTIVARFVQALDPGSAEEFARWDLESPPGNDVDLSTASFSYDLLSKTLTITLTDTDLLTAGDFRFAAAGGAPFPVDVDGEDFTASFTGTITGDAQAPVVASAQQNRLLDPTGMTFEVTLSEDVDAVEAETVSNYSFSSGATVVSATQLAGLDRVRLVVDAETVPGDHTLDVQNLVDLAGNAMGLEAGNALSSTDVVEPHPGAPAVTADTGPDNDAITVLFDDRMLASEVEDPVHWVFESPVGSAVDTSLASVVYDAASRTAVLTFDGGDGINLKNRETFSLTFVAMRDVAGNVVDGTPLTGAVDAEDDFPVLESVWVESGAAQNVHVRFDEPSEMFSDALTSYVVRDAGGLDVGGGPPAVVVDADQLGATLTFGLGVVPGVHTLDVRGVTDLAGNQMFPVELFPITAEDSQEPALDPGLQTYTAVAGEENDTLSIVFDRPVSTWNLLDPANYDLTNGGDTANFGAARFAFDGDRTLDVTFDSPGGIDFDNGGYTLTVDGVLSAQGEAMSSSSVDTATAGPGTDSTPALLVAGETRLDAADPASSVLIELDEAVDGIDAADTSNYAIGGVNPDAVTRLGFRTVRATWLGGVSAGQTVDVTVADLAGNAALASEAIQAADAFGPTVTGVAGIVTPGVGGDRVEVTFSEPVSAASATNPVHYSVTVGGNPIDVPGTVFRYTSATNTVTLLLPNDVHLQVADTLNVMVSGVVNHAGLVMSPPVNVNGSIGGDSVAPDFDAALVNLRADGGGRVVDLLYSEDVDPTLAEDPLMYVVSGGQGVLAAELIRTDAVRLTLSGPLAPGDEVEITGVLDLAGNPSGTIQIEPGS